MLKLTPQQLTYAASCARELRNLLSRLSHADRDVVVYFEDDAYTLSVDAIRANLNAQIENKRAILAAMGIEVADEPSPKVEPHVTAQSPSAVGSAYAPA